MTKSEMARQLASASNASRLNALNQQIEALRQAKISSAEQLAQIIEPLAQAMATLTDETRDSLAKTSQYNQTQSEQFAKQVEETIQAWQSAAAAAERAAQRMERAGRQMEIIHYLMVMVAGVMSGLLASALWLWLAPAPVIQNTLDPKEIAQLLKPEIAAQLQRKGK
ncbi:IncQ-type mobilization protein MobB [Pseudoduganella danionis]|uniref:IncQ-type mobilization protein MobB n=1 Tax=Pseudoduganella danionis TaxID=1890295 RepID=UPI0018B07B4D|nr:IncQ-type mobilization protein MobB [Pseudoduganella danionis]